MIDGRSDLFSLGSVLYEMTTGSTPFPGESLIEVLHAIIHDSPPLLRRSAPEAPAGLERILHKCLEKDPADRYQHADDLAVDLRRRPRRNGLGTAALIRSWLGRSEGGDERSGGSRIGLPGEPV